MYVSPRMQRQQAVWRQNRRKLPLGEGGDEGIEGPIIMHSALLDPGGEKGEYHSTEDMHIQI